MELTKENTLEAFQTLLEAYYVGPAVLSFEWIGQPETGIHTETGQTVTVNVTYTRGTPKLVKGQAQLFWCELDEAIIVDSLIEV
jgi:hypothetical protein